MDWVDIIIQVVIAIVYALTVAAIQHFLTPKPRTEALRPAALGEFVFPTATQGRLIPLIWGTNSIKGPNVVWYGDQKSVGVYGEGNQLLGYQYYIGVQFALCMGQVDGILGIYVNSTQVWSGWAGDGLLNIVSGRIFGGITGGSTGGVGAFLSSPLEGGQFFFYTGGTSQTANAYLQAQLGQFLYQDNFSLGTANESLNNYTGSDPGTYYQISKGTTNNTSITLNPTDADFEDDILITYIGTVVGDAMPMHIGTERLPYPNVPDYTNISYFAALMNPNAPSLSDNFVVSMAFRPRTALNAITYGDTLWFGAMVDNSVSPTNQQGIFVTVQKQGTITLIIQEPGGSQIFSQTFTATGDFPLMDNAHPNLWGLQLTVSGDNVALALFGSLSIGVPGSEYTQPFLPYDPPYQYTLYEGQPVSGLHTTLNSLTGVGIGMEANYNSPTSVIGTGATDYSDAGIYAFSIDAIGRPVISSYPAWPGICYGVFQQGYIGTSTQPPPWAFEVRRCPNGLSLSGGMELVNANGNYADANPANVLYEVLTNPDWGLGFSDTLIDTTSFTAAATTLYNEGNGFSIILDSPISLEDFIAEVERQIYGYVRYNPLVGKWQMKLLRADYTLADCPQINDSNTIEVTNFSHGTWDETVNNLRVAFVDRGNSYSATYAQAQDMANQAIQGSVITAESTYPGVKDPNLANQIAWRDLRLQGFPLAGVGLFVDRSFSSVNVGDVVSWTDTARGISDLAMRVAAVDLGKLEEGKIQLTLSQDIFYTVVPSFAAPGTTSWSVPNPPVDTSATSRSIFESPAQMDRVFGSNRAGLIYAGITQPPDGSVEYDIWTSDNDATYNDVATLLTFVQNGQLSSGLGPLSNGGSIAIIANVSTYGQIIGALQNLSGTFVGSTLSNLVLIDNEFILFTGFSGDGSTTITLTGCYRGVMDTVPSSHSSGAAVWLLCKSSGSPLAGGMSSQNYATGDVVNVKVITANNTGSLAFGLAAPTAITMDGRATLPYPPANLAMNGTVFQSTVSLDIAQTDHTEYFYSLSSAPTVSAATNSTNTSGTYFSAGAAGWVTGVAIYFADAYSSNTVTVDLWTSGGTKIVEAASAVTTMSAPGWIVVPFPNPVYIQASTTYVVSYTPTSTLFQSSNASEFTSPVTVGDITVSSGGHATSSGTPVFPSTTDTSSHEVQPLYIKESAQSLDNYGLNVSWVRRDYRNGNEVLSYSEASLPADFPSNNATEYEVNVFNDPLGANTNIITTAYFNGSSQFYSRTLLLRDCTAIPSEMAVAIGTEHYYPQVSGGTLLTASQLLALDFSTTSNLTNIHSYGILASNTGSGTYTAGSSGTFTLHIGTALPSGVVEVSINGGSYSSVIAATGLTGTFSVTSGQTIAVKSTQTGMSTSQTMMLMTDGLGKQVAWAVLVEG
jgi:Domain of unknown function (DUF4082)/Putative phage tail protein